MRASAVRFWRGCFQQSCPLAFAGTQRSAPNSKFAFISVQSLGEPAVHRSARQIDDYLHFACLHLKKDLTAPAVLYGNELSSPS
jgi:hypothetical protein